MQLISQHNENGVQLRDFEMRLAFPREAKSGGHKLRFCEEWSSRRSVIRYPRSKRAWAFGVDGSKFNFLLIGSSQNRCGIGATAHNCWRNFRSMAVSVTLEALSATCHFKSRFSPQLYGLLIRINGIFQLNN
jgi:hypothetical protein